MCWYQFEDLQQTLFLDFKHLTFFDPSISPFWPRLFFQNNSNHSQAHRLPQLTLWSMDADLVGASTYTWEIWVELRHQAQICRTKVPCTSHSLVESSILLLFLPSLEGLEPLGSVRAVEQYCGKKCKPRILPLPKSCACLLLKKSTLAQLL